MTNPTNHTQKKIAVITMARNDDFFLSRWIKYYGEQFGRENLYIYLDGTDQNIPENAGPAHVKKLSHVEMSRADGDKYRIGLINTLAHKLLKTYDIVIGCDCDEFLVVDPDTQKTLAEYLSDLDINISVSGLGLDVGQNTNTEKTLDINKPILAQREYALLSTRYTKPVVKTTPAHWGSGFHSISGHNFHIDKNLYLLHFGAVDMQMLLNKAKSRGPDWVNHLRRRGNGTINAVSTLPVRDEKWMRYARIIQTFARPIYAFDKPGMFGLRRVVKIPSRFQKSRI